MFCTTIALLASRALLLGLDLELPLAIRGDEERAKVYAPGITIGWLATLFAGVWFLCARDLAAATALLTCSLVSNLFLGGTVRTLLPHSFERLINIPMLLFTAAAIVLQTETAVVLLCLRSIAALMVQVPIAVHHNVVVAPSVHRLHAIVSALREAIKSGWRKLISSLSMKSALRGFILWPKAAQSLALSDSIAFAVAVGDAVYQLGMVFANRRYALLSKQDSITANEIRATGGSGLVLSLIIIAAGIIAVYAANAFELIPALTTPMILNQAIIFYSLLCLFH